VPIGSGPLAFTPDGTGLAAAAGGRVDVWKLDLGQLVATLTKRDARFRSLAFAHDGTTLLIADRGEVAFWNVEQQTTAAPSIGGGLRGSPGPEEIGAATVSRDGQLLAVAENSVDVRLWDLARHTPLEPALSWTTDPGEWSRSTTFPANAVLGLAFSLDRTLLAGAYGDTALRLWDVSSGKMLEPPLMGHTDAVLAVAFSPDGTRLASAGADRTVRLWNVATHQPIGSPQSGHTGWVTFLAFSADGRLLASGGYDGTVQLRSGETGELLRVTFPSPTVSRGGRTIEGLAFSPDGAALATSSSDGPIRLWDMRLESWLEQACRIANRNLTHAEWVSTVGSVRDYVAICPRLPVADT
jgi:WD40 repeat protein